MSLVLSVWFVTFVQWLLETRTGTLSCGGGSHLQRVLHLPSLSEALFTQGHLSLELTAGSRHLTGDTALSSKSPPWHPVPHSRDLHGKGHRVSSCHLCVTSCRPCIAGQAPPSDGPRWLAGTKPGWNQRRFVLFIHRCFWGVQVPGPTLGLGFPVTPGCPCPMRLVLPKVGNWEEE